MQFELPQGYQSMGFMGYCDPPEATAEDEMSVLRQVNDILFSTICNWRVKLMLTCRHCGRLTWSPGAHQHRLSLSLLSWTGEENMTRSLSAEIRTGRSLSNYCRRQNRLNLGKLISFVASQIRVG